MTRRAREAAGEQDVDVLHITVDVTQQGNGLPVLQISCEPQRSAADLAEVLREAAILLDKIAHSEPEA